ncbi:hypothetical protein [Fibrella aquatilis]|uniref:Lipoprotein n=1 Tax=Fibrella aquatilis TaxID=2817059 RepID=A0A939GBC9_9BACT|nr:hypothetical protein [Fibrella aquatilis]MBO0933273.1 hypothetical protein [Fibrella aquatilis]
MNTSQFRGALPLMSVCLFLLLLSGCQREVTIDLDKGFSSQIQQIVPQPIIDSLRKKGMVINEGLIPPQLAGIYLAQNYKLLSPYGPEDSYKLGKVINPYYYRFYGQNAANDITYDFTNNGSDKGNGQGAFVSGNGTKFTIFSQDVGVSSSIPYKTLAVVSGELTTKGIKNFQYAFVMKEKTGDNNNNTLIPVGKSRIWIDEDGLAETTTYFPQAIKPKPQSARLSAEGDAPTMSSAN